MTDTAYILLLVMTFVRPLHDTNAFKKCSILKHSIFTNIHIRPSIVFIACSRRFQTCAFHWKRVAHKRYNSIVSWACENRWMTSRFWKAGSVFAGHTNTIGPRFQNSCFLPPTFSKQSVFKCLHFRQSWLSNVYSFEVWFYFLSF